jgi:hypothetical protein
MTGKLITLILAIFASFLTRTESCEPCYNRVCDTDVSKCEGNVLKLSSVTVNITSNEIIEDKLFYLSVDYFYPDTTAVSI